MCVHFIYVYFSCMLFTHMYLTYIVDFMEEARLMRTHSKLQPVYCSLKHLFGDELGNIEEGMLGNFYLHLSTTSSKLVNQALT